MPPFSSQYIIHRGKEKKDKHRRDPSTSEIPFHVAVLMRMSLGVKVRYHGGLLGYSVGHRVACIVT